MAVRRDTRAPVDKEPGLFSPADYYRYIIKKQLKLILVSLFLVSFVCYVTFHIP